MAAKQKLSVYSEALLAQFVASGLNEVHLRRMHVTDVAPAGDPKVRLNAPSAKIPYFDLDGRENDFYRLRALAEVRDGQERLIRYKQPAGSGNHLYFPPLLSRPWREVAEDPTCRLLITEGEKKAACACALGIPTVALGGVSNWISHGGPISDLNLLKCKGQHVYVVFDSDIRTNFQVMLAAEKLAAELRKRGADVFIATLPDADGAKCGLDDFLMSDPGSAAVRLEGILRGAVKHLDPVWELNEELAVTMVGGKALVLRETVMPGGRRDVVFGRPHEVAPLYANRFVERKVDGKVKHLNVFDLWMKFEHRRQYERVVFEPQGCQPCEYNLWQGLSVEPKAGSCALFLSHVREIICGGDRIVAHYVFMWLATLVQRPWELPGVALVLRGKQGTGKGTFVKIIGRLFGLHYVQVSSSEKLLGNFNAHTRYAVILFGDEALWAGDRRLWGVLKALVTEEQRTIEQKGIDAFQVRNVVHAILATNNDWPVPADMDDRRFMVLDVSDKYADDRAYFGALAAEMEGDGLRALLHFLLNYPAGDIRAERVPKTAALLESKMRTLDSVATFWLDCLANGTNCATGVWEDEVASIEFDEMYSHHAGRVGVGRKSTQTELGMAMAKFVPGLRRRKGAIQGTRGQTPMYVFPSLDECRAAFAIRFGQSVTWQDVQRVCALAWEGESRPSRPFSEVERNKVVRLSPAKPAAGKKGQVGRLRSASKF